MRHVQVIPRGSYRLFDALTAEQARLARKDRGTFRRRGRKSKHRAEWIHVRFPGRLALKRGEREVVEIQVRSKKGTEWQLVRAILGFLDRHFGPRVRAVIIQYGE
jgi:hypothetical protein